MKQTSRLGEGLTPRGHEEACLESRSSSPLSAILDDGQTELPINSCALSMSVERRTVLGRTRFTPAREAAVFGRLFPYKVSRMIGVLGKTLRTSDAAVRPFMTGIERSKVITSGLNCLATSIASLPFSASAHVLKPSDKKAAAVSRRCHPQPRRFCSAPR